ncbi:MAG: hypothetical protein DHS20C11_11080 [Lysobacteraceae bacterium]|nr:MAG: hypothetical protein DHS20C11_11080 [Xanthomonadaceae bacterium]
MAWLSVCNRGNNDLRAVTIRLQGNHNRAWPVFLPFHLTSFEIRVPEITVAENKPRPGKRKLSQT